jgi:hypothetical protein
VGAGDGVLHADEKRARERLKIVREREKRARKRLEIVTEREKRGREHGKDERERLKIVREHEKRARHPHGARMGAREEVALPRVVPMGAPEGVAGVREEVA